MAFRKRGRNQKQGEYMKKLLFIAVVAAVVLVPATVFADVPSGDGSKGVFGGEINDYMNVNKFGGVEFTKNFGYVRAGSNGGLDLGLATRFNNGLYLGFNFDGKLWSGTNTQKKEGGKQQDPSIPVSQTPPYFDFDNWTSDVIEFDSKFEFLVGSDVFGGIKLSLDFDELKSDTSKNEPTGGGAATETTASDGNVIIGLQWGKNFAVGSGTLMPHISATFDIDTAEYKYDDGTKTHFGGKEPLDIGISLGAAYGFGATSGGNEIWADYSINLAAYPDPASDIQDVKTTQTGSRVKNLLGIGSWNGYALNDRWTVAWVATLDLGLDSEDTKSKTVTTAGSTDNKGITTSTFSATPGAAAGIKYNFATKPFTLKAGIGTGIKFEGKKVVNETNTANKIETDTFTWTALNPTLAIGGVLTPTENFYIDMELRNAINDPNDPTPASDPFTWNLDLTRPEIRFLVCLKK
jgi:hypothetical protein